MLKKKIAIIHYLPVEYYPPITNLLSLLLDNNALKMYLYTTHNQKKRLVYDHNEIKISRCFLPKPNERFFFKLLKYLCFNLRTLISLIVNKPGKILYYETTSAWPAYFYLKFVNRESKLYIHNHEYLDKSWYERGPSIVKYYHGLEKKFLYSKAIWISHTNQDRIDMFLSDHQSIDRDKVKCVPNYPPRSWKKWLSPVRNEKGAIRTVYIGSLSLSDTYIEEYCEWIKTQNGRVLFDIYAFNLHDDTHAYLKELGCKFINYYPEGIDYDSIPKILSQYNVGMILYKATTLNFKFNAPNKLFEYLVCGLNVWFPEEMLGVLPFQSDVVQALNFNRLKEQENELLSNFLGYPQKDSSYYSDIALDKLIRELV